MARCLVLTKLPSAERKGLYYSLQVYIYYFMTGSAIWGNIQFEGGSIGPTAGRVNTEPEN